MALREIDNGRCSEFSERRSRRRCIESQARQHEIDTPLERDPEARHARVGDRKRCRRLRAISRRNSGTTSRASRSRCRSAPPRSACPSAPPRLIGGDENLVGGKLARAVKIDRVRGLVGRQRDHPLDTPQRSAARTTFSAPSTLVWMHSNGLYSAVGTCFSAAAWTTIVDVAHRHLEPLRSRTSPMKKRKHVYPADAA